MRQPFGIHKFSTVPESDLLPVKSRNRCRLIMQNVYKVLCSILGQVFISISFCFELKIDSESSFKGSVCLRPTGTNAMKQFVLAQLLMLSTKKLQLENLL